MSLIKKITKAIDKNITTVRTRLEEKNKAKEVKYPGDFEGRRKGLGIVKVICPNCHHNKMWYKHGRYECTKCGREIRL